MAQMQPLTPWASCFFSNFITNLAIISPAGAPDAAKVAAAVAMLKEAGFQIFQPRIAASGEKVPSYLSKATADRSAEIQEALRDESTQLLLCTRGGFGSMHLLNAIPWETMRQRNLALVGYSDITVLHCAMLAERAGVPVAGPMLVKFPELAEDAKTWATLAIALNHAGSPTGLPDWVPAMQPLNEPAQTQIIHALPFAANLTVLTALCGSRFMPDLAGRFLILEDIDEPVYKIDRMLCQLEAAGLLRNLAGLAFGNFSGIPEAGMADFLLLRQAMARQAPYPVYAGFPFGHVFPMAAVNAGQYWTIQSGMVTKIEGY